ncbi:MAG: hypothetical protein WBA62_19090 [Xanthobacteraceae bacterium]
MVYRGNPFADVTWPLGADRNLHNYWRKKAARLAKERTAYEVSAAVLCIVAFAATFASATKDYALFGFLIGGLFVYCAITCRIKEGTIESLLRKFDWDNEIKRLVAEEKAKTEERAWEFRRPTTETELARRADIIQGVENMLKRDA